MNITMTACSARGCEKKRLDLIFKVQNTNTIMKLKGYIIFGLLLCMIGCAQPYNYFAEVLFKNKTFNGSTLSDAPLLLLPLVTVAGLDSNALYGPSRQAAWFKRERKDCVPVITRTFEDSLRSWGDSVSARQFYAALLKDSVLAVQNNDTLWSALKKNAPHIMVVRIINAARIKDFRGMLKRRASLEAAIWDTEKREVVWRAHVRASAMDKNLSDGEFVWSAISAVFSQLPASVPGSNELGW